MEIFKVNPQLIEFIDSHKDSDIPTLSLKYSGKALDFNLNLALIQIQARRTNKRKLARFIEAGNFMFPSIQASEQATNQCVAAFHSLLIGTGKTVVDLTAGLGIDAISIALNGNSVVAMEMDKVRFDYLQYNIMQLDETIKRHHGSIKIENTDCESWLKKCDDKFDTIYIDPARRDSSNKRIFKFSDCTPNIHSIYGRIISLCDCLIIKGSPLLDISKTLKDFPDTSEVILTCLNGECKEVLLIIRNNAENNVGKVKVVNLRDRKDAKVEIISEWECSFDELGKRGSIWNNDKIIDGKFIYDPIAGMHKIRAGEMLCRQFEGMEQLGINTDLFISEDYFPSFPGRIFRIIKVLSKKDYKNLKGHGIDIISRNYPYSSEELKRQLKVKPGAETFIIAARVGDKEEAKLLLCERVSKSE